MSGAKIIEGLKDAVAGNFASVTIDGETWVRKSQWQSIESAPKNGESILAYDPIAEAPTIIRWDNEDGWCDSWYGKEKRARENRHGES
jgi:hypothetical protein